ncbi:MAG: OmpA family protein [Bacteroidia bacterium]|nr:OmpA family protein [Bacteroidia bacterium]
MKSIYSLFIIIGISVLLNSGCVPTRKYKESQARVEQLQNDSTAAHRSVEHCNTSLNACNTSLTASQDLVSQLSDKNASVLKDLQELSANSQMTITEQAKRLADMQKVVQVQKDIMNKLKKTVSDALVGFTPEELSVEIKNGNIYVSLQEKLLFKSGSDQVDPKGKEALQKLAAVLNNNPDINVNIEGHTDSIPIRGKFADNWALSVSRATSIVRILTNENHVDPHRVTASGRGEYFPVESNSIDAGRARNRRTEIILSPNLTELFKLLNQ